MNPPIRRYRSTDEGPVVALSLRAWAPVCGFTPTTGDYDARARGADGAASLVSMSRKPNPHRTHRSPTIDPP